METKQREEAFLRDLSELTKRHLISIDGSTKLTDVAEVPNVDHGFYMRDYVINFPCGATFITPGTELWDRYQEWLAKSDEQK